MKTIYHSAESRGLADHGWLKSRHTFSFSKYYNPERIQFGALRVLNDDRVVPGMGFGTHPHQNMEIVSIPLEGDLEHKDSMGNTMIIRANDVQIMSAGTGIFHSEYNKNADKEVKFLQIWILPKNQDIEPRYEQITFDPSERTDRFQTVVSPVKGEGVWINQDAWFSLANLTERKSIEYKYKSQLSGVYVFVLNGSVEVVGRTLQARDGMGVWDTQSIKIDSIEAAQILVMEVPMEVATH